MRWFALLAAAAGLSAEAPPPPELQQIQLALTGFHYDQAAGAIRKLIIKRTPVDGKPRPDPLLNALLGRLYLSNRDFYDSAAYLDRAPIAALPALLQAPTALDHGKALEVRGDRAGALMAYRQAVAVSAIDEDRRKAVIGIGWQLLPQDPAATRAQVLPIANANETPQRWEANAVAAIASSLLGDTGSAAKFANAAWSDAANAHLSDLAPLRVATLRAGLAAAAHDVPRERAMLTMANGLTLSASPALAAQLPVCGDGGVRPSDFVIFGYVTGPYAVRQLFPISASRPEIVETFQDALGGMSPIKSDDADRPAGTVFTVSCRSIVSADFVGTRPTDNPLDDWLIAQGIYPASAFYESDDQHVNAAADRIDALATQFGKDSPLLIASRWQMLNMLEVRARAGDPVLSGQLTDLATEISQGLRHAGAPDWLAQMIEAQPRQELLFGAAKDDPDKYQAAMEAARAQLLRMPFPLAREYLKGMLRSVPSDWPEPLANTIVELNANTPASLSGRDRQAWLLTVAHAQQALGRPQQAKLTLNSGAFENNLCAVSDSEPKLLAQHFSYDDYPDELIAGTQEGSVAVEFSLSPAGSAIDSRILYSLPSSIFDEVTKKGLSGIRYTAPSRLGKAVGCRGIVQAIGWRIGDDEKNFSLPTLAPGPIS